MIYIPNITLRDKAIDLLDAYPDIWEGDLSAVAHFLIDNNPQFEGEEYPREI